MSVDVTRYLEMERTFYADLVARSNFDTEAFTRSDSGGLVAPRFVRIDGVDLSPAVLDVAGRRCARLASKPRFLLKMVNFLEALPVPGLRIIRCYP